MTTPLKVSALPRQQLVFRRGLEDCIAAHGRTLDAVEILAVLSHLVGQVIAVQDQTKVTPDMAMEVVVANIQRGNTDAIDALLANTGGNA